MASQPEKSHQGDGLLLIHAGLFRTGTKSMARAYQILGLKTHHGLLEKVTDTPWVQLEQAAESTWPSTPGARPRASFTRADWDKLWGEKYDAVTDLASPFALELIRAYPNAKVVVVQRDFERWWPSFQSEVLNRVMLQPMAAINGFLGLYLMGIPAVQAMRKIHFGFFGAQSREEILAHAKDVYETYYRSVRAAVPPEQLLEYHMGDGWNPLCAFLDVEVPNVPFPRENEASNHAEEVKARTRLLWTAGIKVAAPVLLGLAAIWVGFAFSQTA
ncbi:uncharacterized protein N7496_009042 [Penicillium cataractarum]|uniref:Efflux pump antibiotic resistance protein n=1 Tax=Penicillium cataractarum TaxID=2100454 RepID=A0A9W9V5B5_9EURO|nr:uncharacterized protein N7496_009042 [Penicillium cataractarum]KAJ5369282.1 hypothetical protein N7496_009042 [Penicillium cataractarum]